MSITGQENRCFLIEGRIVADSAWLPIATRTTSEDAELVRADYATRWHEVRVRTVPDGAQYLPLDPNRFQRYGGWD